MGCINVIPILSAIVDVSRGFIECLDSIEPWPEHEDLGEHLPVARAIASLPSPFDPEEQEDCSPLLAKKKSWWSADFKTSKGKGPRSPAHNYKADFPLYAILCLEPEAHNKQAFESYRFLKMHVLCAFQNWEMPEKKEDRIGSILPKNQILRCYRLDTLFTDNFLHP